MQSDGFSLENDPGCGRLVTKRLTRKVSPVVNCEENIHDSRNTSLANISHDYFPGRLIQKYVRLEPCCVLLIFLCVC